MEYLRTKFRVRMEEVGDHGCKLRLIQTFHLYEGVDGGFFVHRITTLDLWIIYVVQKILPET